MVGQYNRGHGLPLLIKLQGKSWTALVLCVNKPWPLIPVVFFIPISTLILIFIHKEKPKRSIHKNKNKRKIRSVPLNLLNVQIWWNSHKICPCLVEFPQNPRLGPLMKWKHDKTMCHIPFYSCNQHHLIILRWKDKNLWQKEKHK